jgi:hypothetical protein
VQKSERTTERPSDARDPMLTEAAEFLTAHGRRREAITLVERVFRERRDQDTAFLLTLLLLGSDREDDSRLAQCYLRRLQWQPSPPPRAVSD